MRFKNTIAKMDREDEEKEKRGKVDDDKLPNPQTTCIPRPTISAVTTDQLESCKKECPTPTSAPISASLDEPHVLPVQEKENIQKLDDLLVNVMTDSDETSTPTISNTNNCSTMTVDFGEDQQNTIPIHPDCEDALIPSDCDACGSGALNC